MTRLSLLVYVLLCFVVVSVTLAGPWTRKSGTGFVQLGFSTIGYSKIYDDRAEKASLNVDARDNVLQLLIEYGLTDQVTLSATTPFKFLSVTPKQSAPGADARNSGIGDIEVAAKHSWMNSSGDVFAAELMLGLPTGSIANANGLRTGDGEFNTTIRWFWGRSFYPAPWYLSADIGFNFRTMGFSHDVPYNIEAGYGFMESRLYLILLVSGRESLSNKPTLVAQASTAEMAAAALGLYSNNTEYLAIISKVFFKIDTQWALAASFATAAHGRNVAGGFVFAGGVAYAF